MRHPALYSFLTDPDSRLQALKQGALGRHLFGSELAAGHHLRFCSGTLPSCEVYDFAAGLGTERLMELDGLLDGLAARCHADLDTLMDGVCEAGEAWWGEGIEQALIDRDDMESLRTVLALASWSGGGYLPHGIRIGEGLEVFNSALKQLLGSLPMDFVIQSERLALVATLSPDAWWAKQAVWPHAEDILVPVPDLTTLLGGLACEDWLAGKFKGLSISADILDRLVAVGMLRDMYEPTSFQEREKAARAAWDDRSPEDHIEHWLSLLGLTTAEAYLLEEQVIQQADGLKYTFLAIPHFEDDQRRQALACGALAQRQHFEWLMGILGLVTDTFSLHLVLEEVDQAMAAVHGEIVEALLLSEEVMYERVGWIYHTWRDQNTSVGRVWRDVEHAVFPWGAHYDDLPAEEAKTSESVWGLPLFLD